MRTTASFGLIALLGLVTLAGCSPGKCLAFTDPERPAPTIAGQQAAAPSASSSSDAPPALSGEDPLAGVEVPPPAEPEPAAMAELLTHDLDQLEMQMLLGSGDAGGLIGQHKKVLPPDVLYERRVPADAPQEEVLSEAASPGDGRPAGTVSGPRVSSPATPRVADLNEAIATSRSGTAVTTDKKPVATAAGPTIGGAPASAATKRDLETALHDAGCKIVSRTEVAAGPVQLMVKLDGALYAITFVPEGATRSLAPRELDKLEQDSALRRIGGMLLAVTHADEAKARELLSKLVKG